MTDKGIDGERSKILIESYLQVVQHLFGGLNRFDVPKINGESLAPGDVLQKSACHVSSASAFPFLLGLIVLVSGNVTQSLVLDSKCKEGCVYSPFMQFCNRCTSKHLFTQ